MRAVLFDLDNTLCHLEVDWGEYFRKVSKLFRDFPASASWEDMLKAADKRYWELPKESVTRKRLHELNLKFEFEGVEKGYVLPYARELLESLQRKAKVGISSSNLHETIEKALKRFQIFDYADCMVGKQDAPSKPDAEHALKALRLLNVEPKDAVFVGDSLSDFQCAQNAGMPFVAVLTGNGERSAFEENGVKDIARDLAEVQTILRKF
ncbi:MAG: HAD family hydrolase [Candidatus Diapherotrites archaeon]